MDASVDGGALGRLLEAAKAKPALLPLLQAAGDLQACGRCSLRLAGVRDAAAYGCDSLPSTAAGVLEALQQRQQQKQQQQDAAPAAVDAAEDGSKRRRLEPDAAAAAQADGGEATTAVAAPAAVCPLCLGLLQSALPPQGSSDGSEGASRPAPCPLVLATTVSSLNDPARYTGPAAAWGHVSAEAGLAAAAGESGQPEATAAVAADAADAEGSGRPGASVPVAIEQRTAVVPSLAAAAAGIAGEFEFGSFGLEVSLPASLAVRQQALAWWLRRQPAEQQGAGEALAQALDVKEAVRLCYAAALSAALGKTHDSQAALRIALSVSHPDAAAECGWLAPSGGGGRQRGRQGRGRGRGRRDRQAEQQQTTAAEVPALTDAIVQRLAAMPQGEFDSSCPAQAVRLVAPAEPATMQLQARRKPLHVGGRYLKLRRGIPQSPWFIDGRRKGEGSVQEAIEQAVLPAFQADSFTLVSAGREDIDVRMLGTGRPFILEIQNARRGMPPPEALQRLETAVEEVSRGGVAVRGLFAASPALLASLKEGEQEKQKSYAAVCWAPHQLSDTDVAALEGTRDLEVQQDTPIRVLHRRANLCRPKLVHSMAVRRLEGAGHSCNYFVLQLRTQAGTYIKEFVHGDMGRSRPSLGDLLGGCKAQIVSLDVTEIHMEFGQP